VEHYCRDGWVEGALNGCAHHNPIRGRPPVTPLNERSNTTVEGVAQTGQISPKGTVAHTEWFDGHVDAKATVKPVTGKLSDLRRQHERRYG